MLGPSFIKAGQVLASRPDIVREDYMNELCILQVRYSRQPVGDLASATMASAPKAVCTLYTMQGCAGSMQGECILLVGARSAVNKILAAKHPMSTNRSELGLQSVRNNLLLSACCRTTCRPLTTSWPLRSWRRSWAAASARSSAPSRSTQLQPPPWVRSVVSETSCDWPQIDVVQPSFTLGSQSVRI